MIKKKKKHDITSPPFAISVQEILIPMIHPVIIKLAREAKKKNLVPRPPRVCNYLRESIKLTIRDSIMKKLPKLSISHQNQDCGDKIRILPP